MSSLQAHSPHPATLASPARDLTMTDAATYAAWAAGTSLVILPVGALEQHGPHMPLGTDAFLSTAMARGVADLLNGQASAAESAPDATAQSDTTTHPGVAKVAPTFSFGYKSQQKSGGGNHLPGTVSLDAATLIQLTRDVVRDILEQGVTNLVILNGHYENYQFLYEGIDLALRDLGIREGDSQSVLLLSYWDYVNDETLEYVYPDGFPGWDIEHGGVLETSLMQFLHPEVTAMDRAISHPAADLPRFDRLPVVASRTPETGCLSCPDGSTRDKGERMFSQVTELLATDVAAELRLS